MRNRVRFGTLSEGDNNCLRQRGPTLVLPNCNAMIAFDRDSCRYAQFDVRFARRAQTKHVGEVEVDVGSSIPTLGKKTR